VFGVLTEKLPMCSTPSVPATEGAAIVQLEQLALDAVATASSAGVNPDGGISSINQPTNVPPAVPERTTVNVVLLTVPPTL